MGLVNFSFSLPPDGRQRNKKIERSRRLVYVVQVPKNPNDALFTYLPPLEALEQNKTTIRTKSICV